MGVLILGTGLGTDIGGFLDGSGYKSASCGFSDWMVLVTSVSCGFSIAALLGVLPYVLEGMCFKSCILTRVPHRASLLH